MVRERLLGTIFGVLAGLVLSLGTLDVAFAATADCNRVINCNGGIWYNPVTGQYQCQGPQAGPCSSTNCNPCDGAPCVLNGQTGHSCACNGGVTKAPCSMCIVVDGGGNYVASGCQPIACLPIKCEMEADVPNQTFICVCHP